MPVEPCLEARPRGGCRHGPRARPVDGASERARRREDCVIRLSPWALASFKGEAMRQLNQRMSFQGLASVLAFGVLSACGGEDSSMVMMQPPDESTPGGDTDGPDGSSTDPGDGTDVTDP